MGKIFAIANQKGGVGKTTTAINLSACLAGLGKRTLMIDMDPQGNASSGLGIQVEAENATVYHVLLGTTPSAEVIQPSSVHLLDVLPATITLIGAEIELVPLQDREQRLLKALQQSKDTYDYIIIDCPPSLGLLTLNAMVCADAVIVPLQVEYFALEGVMYLLQTIERVKETYNPKLHIKGMLLTMCDTRTRLASEVAEEVRKHFGTIVFNTIIPRNIRLAEAPSHALPIITYDKRSKGALAYMELAKELCNHDH